MARVLVTGLPGTGKSSAADELRRRGVRVVDTDDPGWREYRPYPAPIDALHRGEWHWVEARMDRLLSDDAPGTLFVVGSARNQASFYRRFDAVVFLTAPLEVLLARVAARTNPYGATERDRAEIVADAATVEPTMRVGCTHVLDTVRPLEDIVADLLAIAQQSPRYGRRR